MKMVKVAKRNNINGKQFKSHHHRSPGKNFGKLVAKKRCSFNHIYCIALYKCITRSFSTEQITMLKLIVCILILVTACGSQEHLTCLRTDDILAQQNSQITQRTVQGPPGKRGAKGQLGSSGIKGQKGEPGIPDNPQMNIVRDQLHSITQELEALKNQTRDNRRVIDAVIKSYVLYVPPNIYVYESTSPRQSWQESRQLCQNWGGDLAVHGVKTLQNRRKLFQSLSIDYHYWIGASDIASEGNWVWLNGERASSSELIWASARNEPNGGRRENCIVVVGEHNRSDVDLAHDNSCTNAHVGLCEKKI